MLGNVVQPCAQEENDWGTIRTIIISIMCLLPGSICSQPETQILFLGLELSKGRTISKVMDCLCGSVTLGLSIDLAHGGI